MADEIRQAEVLTDEEKQLLFGWGENIFRVAARKLSWRPKDLQFLLYADGEPVSHVGLAPASVSVNGEPARVGRSLYCTGGRTRKDYRVASDEGTIELISPSIQSSLK